jgi:hypothetical protein
MKTSARGTEYYRASTNVKLKPRLVLIAGRELPESDASLLPGSLLGCEGWSNRMFSYFLSTVARNGSDCNFRGRNLPLRALLLRLRKLASHGTPGQARTGYIAGIAEIGKPGSRHPQGGVILIFLGPDAD